jgi:chaperone required for assembly of F1-ATPase
MATSKTLIVYTIIKSSRENQDDYWQPIGRAFENKDGSLNVRLNALPVNGELHIREPKDKDEQ